MLAVSPNSLRCENFLFPLIFWWESNPGREYFLDFGDFQASFRLSPCPGLILQSQIPLSQASQSATWPRPLYNDSAGRRLSSLFRQHQVDKETCSALFFWPSEIVYSEEDFFSGWKNLFRSFDTSNTTGLPFSLNLTWIWFLLPEHYNLLNPAIQYPVPQLMQLLTKFLSWNNHPAPSQMDENNVQSLYLDTDSFLAPTRGRRRRWESSSSLPSSPASSTPLKSPRTHTYFDIYHYHLPSPYFCALMNPSLKVFDIC